MSQVLTGVAGSLIITGLANAPGTFPRVVLWCLAVRISPAHWREIYEGKLMPRLLETEAETGHGWLWRLAAGSRCAALLWWEQIAPPGSQRTPPGLGPDEDVVVVVRRHPFVLALPALVCLAGLAAAAALTFAMHPTAGAVQGAWLVWGVFLGWFTWRVLAWRLSNLVLTPRRVMLVSGTVRRRTSELPLARISDVELLRSPTGRLFGYGRILIFGTDLDHPKGQQADQQRRRLGEVSYVPFPDTVLVELQTRLDAGHAGRVGEMA